MLHSRLKRGNSFNYCKLGLEIAKNLILAGPKSVIVYDPTVITIADLGSNFYASLE